MYRFKHGTVEKKACTIPQPFSLHGSNVARPVPMVMEDEAPVFHAKPVSKRMMEAPIGVPPKKAAVRNSAGVLDPPLGATRLSEYKPFFLILN